MQPSLLKVNLSLVRCSGIIVHHLAAENQVPEFALNWRERMRNVDQKVDSFCPNHACNFLSPKANLHKIHEKLFPCCNLF